ncbi:MAG: hypothetical protein H0U70_09465 [Tatlockia sp.]|nr:hypothetical protein [Tatlockia sp.]
MIKGISNLAIVILLMTSSLAYSTSGLLFKINESGANAAADVILCLNGLVPISCQNYSVSSRSLAISATTNHHYPAVGIKVLTPGYQPRGCIPYSNGFCIFALTPQIPTTIILNANYPVTATVGGRVTGLVGSVSLLNNGGDTLIQNTDGSFSFATSVTEGSTYAVTVSSQPATQTCTVRNGTGTVGSSNITNVEVSCSTNAYSVGGTIFGLVGTVTLQNNGVDTLIKNTNGGFTFTMPLAEGSTYAVSVSSQPVAQICTVTNGSGTIANTNVMDVDVSCNNNTTTLSVNSTGTIPVNSGLGSITVTNTGINTAFNVSVILPSAWTGVTQDASSCTIITPGNGCHITFTSTTPYIAQASIPVSGDNISNPPVTALAFSVGGYLVWDIINTTTVQG